jgi:hypothetical protein
LSIATFGSVYQVDLLSNLDLILLASLKVTFVNVNKRGLRLDGPTKDFPWPRFTSSQSNEIYKQETATALQ